MLAHTEGSYFQDVLYFNEIHRLQIEGRITAPIKVYFGSKLVIY